MPIDWDHIPAALWRHNKATLVPVQNVDPIRLQDLVGIDDQAAQAIGSLQQGVHPEAENQMEVTPRTPL